jgi:hypothetical protein
MGALATYPDSRKPKSSGMLEREQGHIAGHFTTSHVLPREIAAAHATPDVMVGEIMSVPIGSVPRGQAGNATLVFSGSDVRGSAVSRPFAVDYASSLMRALCYEPVRETEAKWGLVSAFGHLKELAFGSRAEAVSGAIAYNKSFRSDGYVLAGSGAIGVVFGHTVTTIGGALEQLLGTGVVEAKPIQVYNGNISSHSTTDATYVALWSGSEVASTSSSLISRIKSLDVTNLVDQEAQGLAARSMADAITLLHRHSLTMETAVSLSDDGVLTIKWLRDSKGALLIFGGEGIVTFAIRKGDQNYGSNYREISIERGLDREVIGFIQELAAQG